MNEASFEAVPEVILILLSTASDVAPGALDCGSETGRGPKESDERFVIGRE